MKKILLFVFSLLLAHITKSQPHQQWERKLGSNRVDEQVKASAVDSQGNIYTTGFFTASYFVGNSILFEAEGNTDIFLTKYDPNGNFIWSKRMGGIEDENFGPDKVNNIEIVGNSIYLIGVFSNTMNFNTPYLSGSNEISSAGGYDAFIAKFDTDGNYLWAKRAGGIGEDQGNDLVVSGNFLYITGGFEKQANFNTPGNYNSNVLINADITETKEYDQHYAEFDTFFAKYTIDGNIVWIKRIGGVAPDAGSGIAINSSGVYITGGFMRTMTFDVPSGDLVNPWNSVLDIFLAKFDFNGNFIWSRRAGSLYTRSLPTDILIDGSSIYITGQVYKDLDYNSPSSSQSPMQNVLLTDFYDFILCKFNESGSFIWAKRFGEKRNTLNKTVKMAKYNGDIYVCGNFEKFMNFSNPLVENEQTIVASSDSSYFEVYVAKFRGTDGGLLWAKRYGSMKTSIDYYNPLPEFKLVRPSPVSSNSILIKSDGSIVITGIFNLSTNFNNPSNNTNNTLYTTSKQGVGFLCQLNSSGNFGWATKRADSPSDDFQFNTGQKMAVDANENVYVTGSFRDFIGENTKVAISAGFSDIFLAKYNKNGVLQWVRRAGGTDEDIAYDIKVYANTILITGKFKGVCDFNTPSSTSSNTLTSAGGFDMFVARYNSDGTFVWAKRGGGTKNDSGNGIEVNTYGVFVTGDFDTEANFNTPASTSTNKVTSAGLSDIFLAEFNITNGAVVWIKRSGGLGDDKGFGISSEDSYLYITGTSASSQLNFNTPSNFNSNTIDGYGSYTGYVAKFGTNGSFQWVRKFGGMGIVLGNSVVAKNNNVYIGGEYGYQLSFSQQPFVPNSPSNLFADYSCDNYEYGPCTSEGYLAKFSSTGTFIWAKRSGGDVKSIALSPDGNYIYFAGKFTGLNNKANFNTPSSAGTNEITSEDEDGTGVWSKFLAKFSIDGNFVWAINIGKAAYYFDQYQTGSPIYYNFSKEELFGIVVSNTRIFISGTSPVYSRYGVFIAAYFDGSITTNALSGSSFCAGTNISVPFTTSTIFDAGNSFKVELSNASGVFPTKNSFIGTGTTSPITSGLPSTVSGTNYKVRVVSTSPVVVGSPTPIFGNGFDIIPASDGGTITGGTTVCAGKNTTTLTLNNKVGNVLYWQGSVNPAFNSSVTTFNSTSTTLTLTDRTVGAYYRAVVQNSSCALDYSTSAQVDVSPTTVAGTLSSVNGIFCAGINNNTIQLTGKVGNVLKWQSSSNSAFTSPVDINNTSTSLNVTNINSTTYYRAVVKSGACAEINTGNRQIAISSTAVTLNNSNPLNSVTFPVKSNFTITGENAITGNSNVLFRSNKSVELKPGFRAENGTIFKAEIGGCN